MNANNLFNDLTAGLFTQSPGLKNSSYGNYLFADRAQQKKTSAGNAVGKDFRDILSSTSEQGKDASPRQIRNTISKTANKIQDGMRKPGTGSGVFNEAKAEIEEKGRQVIKKAAQMLDIRAEELTSILASMNISMSDMAGNLPVETLVNQISAVAGLDMGQKNMLGGVLVSARESVYGNTAGDTPAITGLALEKQEGTVLVEGIKEEAVSGTEGMTKSISVSDAESSDGQSLSAGRNKLTDSASTPGDKTTEITVLVAKLQDGAKAKEPGRNLNNTKDVNTQSNEVPDTSESRSDNLLTSEYALLTSESGIKNNKVQTGNPETFNVKTDENSEPAAAQTMQSNGHGGTDGSSQEALSWDRKAEVIKVEVSGKTDSTKTVDLFQGIMAPQMEADAGKAVKADIVHKIPVAKEEVFSQIAEKAKVVIDGGKSEMVMELKPESLGKLSLKIIHERGIILAKFTAESEQVKQILETNMQLLKDVLQKQGLSVQGFDVSVGQDASARQQAFENGNRRKSDKLQTGLISSTLLKAEQFTDSSKNRYNWSQSSINLTA